MKLTYSIYIDKEIPAIILPIVSVIVLGVPMLAVVGMFYVVG